MVQRLALLAIMARLLVSPWPVVAQDALRVATTHVTSDFPTSITFHVQANGGSDITKVEVRFSTEHSSCTRVESSGFPDFTPGNEVSAQWTWDVREGGSLPPGVVVRYRWIIEDRTGTVVETPEQRYQVVDERHRWRTTSSDLLNLHWYQGDAAFSAALLDAAEAALDQLESFATVRPARPVDLFIYGSAQELRDAIVFPQEWTGGVSFSGFSIVAIGISPTSLAWGQRAISHELTHVVLDQITFNCFRDIPTWLNEGLATYNESGTGQPQPAYARELQDGIEAGELLSVPSLGGSFPTDAAAARLAYGESLSLVQYLSDTYGAGKLGELLDSFRSGTTADVALEDVYGFDQRGLEEEWRSHIGAPPPPDTDSADAPALPAPIIPTFEPFTLTTPTPDVPGATATATPTAPPQVSVGGCTGGLPPPERAGSRSGRSATLPLAYLLLAGLALGIRRAKH